jgi:hypothetical protein
MTDEVLDFLREKFARLDARLDAMQNRTDNELANLRDAINVLTAMAIRHEASIQTVVQELHVIHRHNKRTDDRLRKLEDAPAPV